MGPSWRPVPAGDHAPAGWATTQTVVAATRSMPTTLIGVEWGAWMSRTSRLSKSIRFPAMYWRAVFYIEDKATPEQREAILNVFSGKLGGAFAGVASLVGERVAIHSVPIEHRVEGGKGTLRVGEVVEAEMTPYTDADGRPTTIHDTVFSTIPVSPAYLAKASRHRVNIPEYGMIWEVSGRNAIQGDFHFEA